MISPTCHAFFIWDGENFRVCCLERNQASLAKAQKKTCLSKGHLKAVVDNIS